MSDAIRRLADKLGLSDADCAMLRSHVLTDIEELSGKAIRDAAAEIAALRARVAELEGAPRCPICLVNPCRAHAPLHRSLLPKPVQP